MAGNITQVERLQRMVKVRELMEEGLSNSKIAKKLGMEISSVNRAVVYVNELAAAELSSKEIADKRAELYLEITEAAIDARKIFDRLKEWTQCNICDGKGYTKEKNKRVVCNHCKGFGGFIRTGEAKKFFDAWMDAIDRRMKIYGLDNNKSGDIVFNQQINNNQYVPPDRVDSYTADKMAKLIKSSHEKRIKDRYEESREY